LLGTVRDRLAVGAPIQRLALTVAGWMRYVAGTDDRGRSIELRDPLPEMLKRMVSEHGPAPARLAPALFAIRVIFGNDLPADERFTAPVIAALERLQAIGARAAVAEFGGTR
jgi:fructuronate reductase